MTEQAESLTQLGLQAVCWMATIQADCGMLSNVFNIQIFIHGIRQAGSIKWLDAKGAASASTQPCAFPPPLLPLAS